MKYLTPAQILFIHDQVVRRTGGSQGVRDLGLLESAAYRPKATFGSEDLYITIFDKAAALFQSLLKNHPFVDGNKRTALASTGIFLKQNGYRLINSGKKEVSFTIKVDNGNLSVGEIADWLQKHSKKIS